MDEYIKCEQAFKLHYEALMLRGARLLAQNILCYLKDPYKGAKQRTIMVLECCLKDRESLFNMVFLEGASRYEHETVIEGKKKKPTKRIKRIYVTGKPTEDIMPGYNELIKGETND